METEHNINQDANTYTIEQLTYLRNTIEKMSDFHQKEILQIFIKYKSVVLNENIHGTHINLTDLSNDIINELLLYVQYVHSQESDLKLIEQQKEEYKNIYFKTN